MSFTTCATVSKCLLQQRFGQRSSPFTIRRFVHGSLGMTSSSCSSWTTTTIGSYNSSRKTLSRLVLPNINSSSYHQNHASQQLRWRHSAKIGHMKETLEELAHRPEREAAQERRQKKKDKAAQKKDNSTTTTTAAATTTTTTQGHHHGDEDDDLHFLGVDDDDDHHLSDDGDHESLEGVEPTLPNLDQVESKMMVYVERFQETLKSIRGAEPTAEMFDDIPVMAYGSSTPLKAVGQVVIVSPTLAQITCFDPSVAKDVQKAIQLELEQSNPQMEEGGIIKVPLPRVSMEVREQTAKQLKKKAEATKQRIRQVRRKAMEVIKKGKDGKIAGISKDDAFASAKELDTRTESVTDRLQKLVDGKMNSIMAV